MVRSAPEAASACPSNFSGSQLYVLLSDSRRDFRASRTWQQLSESAYNCPEALNTFQHTSRQTKHMA
eukprot:3026036-Alexandrium_andersonii.AAC.1